MKTKKYNKTKQSNDTIRYRQKEEGKKEHFSTYMQDKVLTRRDKRNKPHVLVIYDHTKGGVDLVDLISLISAKMLTRMKTRRWTMNALAFMLDTARTRSTFQFTWKLGKALAINSIRR